MLIDDQYWSQIDRKTNGGLLFVKCARLNNTDFRSSLMNDDNRQLVRRQQATDRGRLLLVDKSRDLKVRRSESTARTCSSALESESHMYGAIKRCESCR